LNTQIAGCLDTWGISLLDEWDLLVFLHRHRKSLLTVEDISMLLGYTRSAVTGALKKFEKAGLVLRSRSSQGIRFNQLVPSVDMARRESFELLVSLFENPLVRGLVAGKLTRAPATRPGLRRAGMFLT
jgi:DNA-binding transcriptional ArsR family regulator